MRKLKRWWGRVTAEARIASRRDVVLRQIKQHLGLGSLPRLVRGGGMGHDSNYILHDGGFPVAVLRLVNPHKKRQPPPAGMPVALLPPEQRLAREWEALARGYDAGIAPKPLWRADDALLCAYLPQESLQKKLLGNPARVWDMAAAVAPKIAELHRLGVTHMDMSFPNVLADEKLENVFFVDFEYAPAPGFSDAEQRLYDHLRLIESVWKFIPAEVRKTPDVWVSSFAGCLDADMRSVDLERLRPALARLLGDAAVSNALRRVLRH